MGHCSGSFPSLEVCPKRLKTKPGKEKRNSKLHSLFYGMENTAADRYWNDVRLTMNVSGLG